MTSPNMKTCLVISYGPVPTPQYQTIEGGGMRAWGLAEGLKHSGVEVTVGVNNAFPQELAEHDGIKLTNWGQDARFADLINSYDAVIISYCMGSDSVFVAEHINDSVQLILDVYVPIYVEVSARESNDNDTEYRAYMEDIQRFNMVLRRGDYFLCANQTQKTFYIGVLASLGIVNPRSYREDRILVVPFGIHDIPATAAKNPYRDLGIKESDFVVMWFGGLYPWFRIEELLGAILELSKKPDVKFVIIGGKNPFNPNPDFFRQYEKAVTFAKEHGLTDKSMFFVDWVDFNTRIDWFRHADIVISLNQPGEENGFSWRTRVMDFVWGELAILTNGGDPLSENLLRANAALRLEELSADEIAKTLLRVHKDRGLLRDIEARVTALKPDYFWHNVTKPIAEIIRIGAVPFTDEKSYKDKLKLSVTHTPTAVPAAIAPNGKLHQIKRVAKLPPRIIRYAKRKGLRRSAQMAASIAKSQARELFTKRPRRFVFISHPINDTGAPAVLMQMIHEFAEKYGAKNIHVVAPHIEPHHLRRLREMGVKVDKAAHALGYRLVKLQLNLRKDDFVMINTIAIYDNYRDYVLRELELGRLNHAYWFIHEDKAQIAVINREFENKHNVKRIHRLADKGKLVLVTPSKRTRKDYTKILGTKHVQTIPLLVDVPKKYQAPRPVKDYKTVRFFLSGMVADGRKGQLIAIAALHEFLTRYYEKNPGRYRDFSLTMLSVGEDYISQQVRWIGTSLLGKRLRLSPPVPRAEALKVASECNAVICCSLNETFGLYVAECMFMGHVVLRNNSAGMEEQLKDGINGYFIDHTDALQFAGAIEKLLNKDKTSDADLQKMGAASQEIIQEYSKNNYIEKIESLS